MSVGLQVWSQTAATNSTADTNISWPEGMAPSQVNDSARATMASAAKWRDDNSGTLSTTGSTVAFTVTSNQVSTGNTNGYTIAAQFHAIADSSATLNVDGQGAVPIQLVPGTNLFGGEISAGQTCHLTYSSSATAWIVNNLGYINLANAALFGGNSLPYGKIQTVNASKLLGNPTSGTTNVQEISLGTNLSFSGNTLNAGNNTPVVTTITSTATTTWQSTTQNGNFPLYIRVRMAAGGGGGGAAVTNNGSTGTDTTFNNWTAVGGGKGLANGNASGGGASGTGGSNGTGTLISRIGGVAGANVNGASQGSGGGSAFFNGGAIANNAATAAGVNGIANSGGGGSGGSDGTHSGGGGGGGECVEFIVTSPSTSYTVQVGPGGAGGNAGTQAGGNGAAGRIEVTAYWQ